MSTLSLYDVIVPAGCVAGDTFQVQVGEDFYDVSVPDGCEPGSSIETLLPSVERTTPKLDMDVTQETCEVEIPDGCCRGDEFLVETLDGLTFAVTVPDNGLPGMLLQVALPGPRADNESPRCVRSPFKEDKAETSLQQWHEPQEPDQTSGDVWVDELGGYFDDSYLIQRSDGSYSEGWIKEFDPSCGLYHVLIVGVGYKYVSREQIEVNTVHF